MTSAAQAKRKANPWRIAGWGTALGLLLLPLLAMQFTAEVDWTFSDFLFAAMMFGLVGLTLELVVRASPSWFYRGGVTAAVLATFLLTWVNLAVGFIGNEDNPANALYFCIPALVLLASALAGFQATGMAWAMVLAAAVQVAIPLAIMGFGLGDPVRIRPIEFPIATGIFAALWLTSAALFRHAARQG